VWRCTSCAALPLLLACSSVAQAAPNAELCIDRPSESGGLNQVATRIMLTGAPAFALAGGESRCTSLAPGRVQAQAVSPAPFGQNRSWSSAPYALTLTAGQHARLFLCPLTQGAVYRGWALSGLPCER